MTVQSVDFSFFNKLDVQGVLVMDRAGDTLLYAGAAKVTVNDWFFMKDYVTLHYLGLDNAVVNMKRTDKTWNYQFLLDYFSSPSKSKDTSGGISFDFKEAHFRNIRFNRIDGWVGQNMIASMNKMDVWIDTLDLPKQKITIKNIKFDTPSFELADYTGKRPVLNTDAQTRVTVVDPGTETDSGWNISVKNILVTNGNFQSDQETERAVYTDRFDGQHILISAINGNIENVRLQHDSLTANVILAAKERCGFVIRKIQSAIKFTPEIMEFRDLDLVTNNSHLRNYYSMRYESFNSDMQNFLHNVRLEGRFTDSQLSSDDLAFFAPQLASWKRNFYFSGNAKGTIDNLSAKNMKIKSGNTFVDGDIALRGLPEINETFIDFKGNNFQTTYNELVTIIPSLKNIKQPQLSKLGNIYYKGNFTGFINDFVTYGTLKSDLGWATTDINMKLPANGPPLYSGRINTDNFRLGAFMNTSELGNISLNGAVKGAGFNLKDLDANFNGTVRQFEFNGYNFRNIVLDGKFQKKQFTGHLTIDDPNLKIRKLDGTLSLAGKKEIAFNLDADLEYAHLKNIHFTRDDLSLSGFFSLNFTGNDIDNFLGSARVYSAQLKHDTTLLSFDSLTLTSTIEDEKKQLTLRSNQVDAQLVGQFRVLELPDAFQVFLNRYYPAYIKKPAHAVSDQHFNFDITTREVDEYVRLFDKRLSGFNNSTVKGHLNLANSELTVNADVPEFAYDGKTFINTKLRGNGNGDTLKADVAVDDFAVNDSLHFPETKLHISANNDVSVINLKTSAGSTLNDAELNATVQTYSDGVKIHFSPSSFVVHDRKWLLENDGELTIRKNYLDANEIKFTHEKQQIVISSVLDDETDRTHIVAKLQNVDIGDFAPFLTKDPSLEGILTGTATVSDPFGKTMIEFTGTADSFAMNHKYIGKVSLDADANTNTGLVSFKAGSTDSAYVFDVAGTYNYKDSTGSALNLDFMGKKVNINILEPYLGSIFSSMNGLAETNLKIYERKGNQYITGIATLLSDTITIDYTQCKYILNNQVIHFNENEIDLGYMLLKDTLNNEGALSGKIYHRFFGDLAFQNVKLQTGKLALLHTSRKDNADFYGNVIGRATLDINGPTSNLIMDISGEPSFLDSSHIYLPTGTSREANSLDYIEFVQFGSEMKDVRASNSTNITVNLNLKANPSCKVDVILDEETGDIIKAQGSGTINIRVGTREPLNIRGVYELSQGEYIFNFQTFLDRPFTLSSGTIAWNGDPNMANIDIEAQYLAEGVDISQLSTSGKLVQKEDIIIKAFLTGSLQVPQIKFQFDIPTKSEASRDYIIVKRLADFENDPNEMNKQVASLLLFNSFIIGDQNFLSGGNTLAAVTNTIGGIISGWLTGVFNKQLERATNGKLTTYIDINPTVDLQKNASQLQANVKAGLRVLLSSRLVLLVGGNYDSYGQQLEKKGLLTPDISIEWLLNKEGTLRVVGFNRSSIDFTLNQRNRSGIQLSYRKDVNKLGDIFKTRKKLATEEAKQQEAAGASPAKLP